MLKKSRPNFDQTVPVFFSIFSKVDPKNKTPINSTICATIIASFLAGIFELSILIDVLSIGTLAAYALVAICVLILRYRPDPEADINQGPTDEQGKSSTSVIYFMALWDFFWCLGFSKSPFIFPENMVASVKISCFLAVLCGNGFCFWYLKKIPETTKQLNFKGF